jgi:hypothetical protein
VDSNGPVESAGLQASPHREDILLPALAARDAVKLIGERRLLKKGKDRILDFQIVPVRIRHSIGALPLGKRC